MVKKTKNLKKKLKIGKKCKYNNKKCKEIVDKKA